MRAVLIPAALTASICFVSDRLFRYTFFRTDELDFWNDDPGEALYDRAFFERPDRELLELTSRDGLRLRGWFYDQGGSVTVILCHGYRGGPQELSGIASYLCARGMNALLIYQRAYGLSEGSYQTMGVKEKQDAADWCRLIAARKPGGKIVLFGWSMGGNTVMGAVGEDLPENVVCAVEDSGYENLNSQLLFSCRKTMPRLPAKCFFLCALDAYCRLFRGFTIEDSRSAALARCRIPMLFIHGDGDRVVPFSNLDLCYNACASAKQRSAYTSAPHIGSCGRNPTRYFGELYAFIDSCTR